MLSLIAASALTFQAPLVPAPRPAVARGADFVVVITTAPVPAAAPPPTEAENTGRNSQHVPGIVHIRAGGEGAGGAAKVESASAPIKKTIENEKKRVIRFLVF